MVKLFVTNPKPRIYALVCSFKKTTVISLVITESNYSYDSGSSFMENMISIQNQKLSLNS